MVQHRLEWRGQPLLLPVFCYENRTISVLYTASTAKVRPLLPLADARLVEVFPGRCLVGLNCFQYRDTDIGPYNEVAISFLITYDRWAIPGLSALGPALRREITAYVWQLPVTTEIARDGGLEIYGYPKFLADVDFHEADGRIRCSVVEEGRSILTLEGPVLPTREQAPIKYVTYSVKDGIPLVATVVQNPLSLGIGVFRKDVELTLGADHPIGQTLSELGISNRAIAWLYSPSNESVLFAARNLLDG